MEGFKINLNEINGCGYLKIILDKDTYFGMKFPSYNSVNGKGLKLEGLKKVCDIAYLSEQCIEIRTDQANGHVCFQTNNGLVISTLEFLNGSSDCIMTASHDVLYIPKEKVIDVIEELAYIA